MTTKAEALAALEELKDYAASHAMEHGCGKCDDSEKLAAIVRGYIESAEQRWISVSQRLPEVGKNCLLSVPGHGGHFIYFGRLGLGHWDVDAQDNIIDIADVTHWMEMPPGPTPPPGSPT